MLPLASTATLRSWKKVPGTVLAPGEPTWATQVPVGVNSWMQSSLESAT